MLVIFDFDGVVNKSDYFSVNYQKEFGIPQEDISIFFNQEFDKSAIGKVDIKELLLPYLIKWNWKKGVDSFLRYWFNNDINLDVELLEYIGKLKRSGIHVVLASQQEKYRRNHIWNKLGMDQVFSHFYCTCDMGCLKSDREFYAMIVDNSINHNIVEHPDEIIFFDDSETFVNTAVRAGIESHLVLRNQDIYDHIKRWLED